MLYKKYHRDFVKQFKKGTKVRYWYDDGTRTIIDKVIVEPFIYQSSITRRKYCWIEVELVDGYLKIIDDRGRKPAGMMDATIIK